MKLIKTIIVATIAIASISASQAQNLYAGAGFTTITGDTGYGSVTPTMTLFSLGYAVNENFAIEGRVGASASSSSSSIGNVPISVKVGNYSAIYLKGILPLNEQFALYGIAGSNNPQITIDVRGGSVSTSQSSSSYGVGAEFNATKNIAVTGEWVRMASDMTGMTFGVKYKF